MSGIAVPACLTLLPIAEQERGKVGLLGVG